jgi:hypothetical protein
MRVIRRGFVEEGNGRVRSSFGATGMSEPSAMWALSHRFDERALPLADRHYNRRKVGSPQFVPPGRCVVLLTADADALWVTSWPFAEYVRHDWPGAWVCSCFRNESEHLSSAMIREAVAVTRWRWPEIPDVGMVTFVDKAKTRQKRDPGYCFLMAGFVLAGHTKGGLVALTLAPDAMPEPMVPASYEANADQLRMAA